MEGLKMIRKTLGLAMVGVLAMSAMAASAAQAEVAGKATTAAGTVAVDATMTKPGTFTRAGRPLTCEKGHFKDSAVTSGDTTLEMSAELTGCVYGAPKFPATVIMGGCEFLFHLTNTKGTFTALSDLVCTGATKHVLVKVYSNSEHVVGNLVCEFTFAPQSNKKTVTVTNVAGEPNNGSASVNMTGLESKRIFGSTLNCGAEIDAAGSMAAEWEVYGTNEIGVKTGVTVS